MNLLWKQIVTVALVSMIVVSGIVFAEEVTTDPCTRVVDELGRKEMTLRFGKSEVSKDTSSHSDSKTDLGDGLERWCQTWFFGNAFTYSEFSATVIREGEYCHVLKTWDTCSLKGQLRAF